MRRTLWSVLMLLVLLLCGIAGGALGMMMDAAEARRMKARGEKTDVLPVMPVFGFVLGAITGTQVARLISSPAPRR